MSALEPRRWLIPFRSNLLPQMFCDTLVIGSGVAGLRVGIGAAESGDTIVLAKDDLEVSCTSLAQGGIAAVTAADDSIEQHIADTLTAGFGLCEEAAVRQLIEGGPAEIDRLIKWGMRVDRGEDGCPQLGLEGGHSRPRILHSDGDATGRELLRTLLKKAQSCKRLRLFDRCHALDILTVPVSGRGASGTRAAGAITWHPRYGLQIIWARATVLASGGAGQVYRETSNPTVATGDAIALGYRAGAWLADLEFVQFHPTALYIAGAPRHLISEAVRGEGALLIDSHGDRFMPARHPMADLAPRDFVSRGIVEHLAATGGSHVFLDARKTGGRFASRFPSLGRMLAGYGIDPAHDLIPVHPAAHFTIGGAWTDLDGRTSIAGLYACGEAAANGLHGANRLASNSLLEGLVFGARVAAATAGDELADPVPIHMEGAVRARQGAELDLSDIRSSLRSTMWRNVGILREGSRLSEVLSMFDFWSRYSLDAVFDHPSGWDVQNMLMAGALITRAALHRTESRGVHSRTDYPLLDPCLACHLLWRVGEDTPRRVPVGALSGVLA